MARRDLRILMLLSDGFGGVGGIAKFNRDFLRALNRCEAVGRVHALPRVIAQPIEGRLPEYIVFDRNAAHGRLAFFKRLMRQLFYGPPADLVICGHINLLPAAWVAARFRGARLALILHGVEAWEPPPSRLICRLVRRLDAFISVSHTTAERFCGWSGAGMERGFVLPNGIDMDRFRPLPRDPVLQAHYGLSESRVILSMGRLAGEEKFKGFDRVIQVMPRLHERFPTLKYLVVGDGSDRPRLEEMARMLGVSDHVVFSGWIAEKEKVNHYNLADAFVLPSTGEGFGIVLIEAAACGIPVVGSSADASRETLLEGRLGRLVDPQQPRQIGDAIAEILAAGAARTRDDGVETYSMENFNARVNAWIRTQAAQL